MAGVDLYRERHLYVEEHQQGQLLELDDARHCTQILLNERGTDVELYCRAARAPNDC